MLSIQQLNDKRPVKSRLTVISESFPKKRSNGYPIRQVLCRCECGEERIMAPTEIKVQLSCGCIFNDFVPANKKYSISHPKLKGVYYAMIDRCYNTSNKGYKTYGAKGVIVCDEWKNNPQSFFDWAAIGYREGLQLDKDIIGNGLLYSPLTCCWITHKENQSKTARSHKVKYNGEEINLSKLSEISNIPDETLRHRITNLKLSPEDAVKWEKHKHTKPRNNSIKIK